MPRPNLRELARELGLSNAAVSMALRDDPRISKQTTARVKALAMRRGYYVDPVVAEGMSRARRKDFYQETVVWVLSRPPQKQPWLKDLFAAAEERGRMLGYRIEYCTLDAASGKRGFKHLAKVWQAKGIHGVLVGPLDNALSDPPFPWEDFSWVTIGQSLLSPELHRVGRDYDKDIARGIKWLREQGCLRPGFVEHPMSHHLMGLPMLRASLVYYHQHSPKRTDAFHKVDFDRPAEFERWLKKNRFDSLVVSACLYDPTDVFLRLCMPMPHVVLSPSETEPCGVGYVPNYASMGNSAMGLLHRTVFVSSGWRKCEAWPAKPV
ncbi:MAG: transcriptional regulator [Rariglobus sp.]|nr:transcriptional regulator [Rariglobus sp.]